MHVEKCSLLETQTHVCIHCTGIPLLRVPCIAHSAEANALTQKMLNENGSLLHITSSSVSFSLMMTMERTSTIDDKIVCDAVMFITVCRTQIHNRRAYTLPTHRMRRVATAYTRFTGKTINNMNIKERTNTHTHTSSQQPAHTAVLCIRGTRQESDCNPNSILKYILYTSNYTKLADDWQSALCAPVCRNKTVQVWALAPRACPLSRSPQPFGIKSS